MCFSAAPLVPWETLETPRQCCLQLFVWFSPLLPAAVLFSWLHGVSFPAESIFSYCYLGICDSSELGGTGKIGNLGRIILQKTCSSDFSMQKTLCPLAGQWQKQSLHQSCGGCNWEWEHSNSQSLKASSL